MDSSRRALLAAVGGATTALAGCSFLAGDEAEPAPTDTLTPAPVTPTRSVPGDLQPVPEDVPETSLVESAATGRTYAFTETETFVPAGGFVRSGFVSAPDPDGPATVRTTLYNEGETRKTFDLGRVPVFSGGRAGTTPNSRVVLVPTDRNPFTESAPSLRRNDAGEWVLDENPEGFTPGTVELGPGGTATAEYALVGFPDVEGPLVVGRYVFGRGGGDFLERALYGLRVPRPSVGVTVWETDRPGPRSPSRFASAPTPPLPGLDRAVWYHATDGGRFLEPLTERVRTPTRTAFVLKNHTDEPFGGYLTWRLYKRVDGDWYALAPRARQGFSGGRSGLAPGDYAAGTVGLHYTDAIPNPRRDVTEPFVGGGRYAAAVVPGDDATEGYATLFDVVGPDVALSPAAGVTVEEGSDVVTAESPDAPSNRPSRLTLERAPDATPVRRLVPEQVMRIRGVRNTLAPLREATDADRAVLRTREAVARQTSYSLTGDPERTAVAFSFAGTTYRLTLPGLGGEGRASPTPTPVV